MKFSEYRLSKEIKQNLAKAGFIKPTDIQYKSIPHIQKGEDLLAIAQTGTGKTAAFAIPLIDKIQYKKNRVRGQFIRSLVMVPTRELGTQLAEVFTQIGKSTGVRIEVIHGGVDQGPQIQKLVKGVDIVIATPGRLFDLVHQGFLKFDRLETLVLDEADHMLDLGFYKDIKDLLRHLPQKRQTLFFSATIDQHIKKLAYSLVRNPIRIQISPKDPVSKNVDHAVTFVEMDDKRFFLERIIKENKELKILVFVRTQVRADRVKAAMNRVDLSVETLHGGKDQKLRESILHQFKSGAIAVMVATDVTARGIDIPNVDYVINYDLPEKPENYVHRVGRTGRGKNKGQALSFCSKGEKALLKDIEDFMQVPVHQISIDKATYQETLSFSGEEEGDWRKLMKQEEEYQQNNPKKKKRK